MKDTTNTEKKDGTDYRIVIAQCTNQKRDGEHPARDLYDESAYFRKQRRYAEAVADEWFIQSAEYGLVAPDEEIQSYDTRPSDDRIQSEAWAWNIADTLEAVVEPPVTVEILGGKEYADPLTPELEGRGYDVLEPLRGQPIGKRMRTLDGMVDKNLEEYV